MTQSLMPLATLSALSVFPLADRFPYISDDEILDLAQSIEVDGLIHPIVLFENEILDGRNRLRALAKTNLTSVPVTEFEGSWADAVFFVLSANVRRRHMKSDQVAALAVDQDVIKAATERAEAAHRANGGDKVSAAATQKIGEALSDQSEIDRHQREAAALAIEAVGGGTNREYVRQMTKLAPEVQQAILMGETTLADEYGKLRKRQENSPGISGFGDIVRPEPQPEYGIDTGTSVTWDERDVSYEERRRIAIEVLIRDAERLAEKIERYAVTDGDVTDSAEQLYPESARLLADFFESLA